MQRGGVAVANRLLARGVFRDNRDREVHLGQTLAFFGDHRVAFAKCEKTPTVRPSKSTLRRSSPSQRRLRQIQILSLLLRLLLPTLRLGHRLRNHSVCSA